MTYEPEMMQLNEGLDRALSAEGGCRTRLFDDAIIWGSHDEIAPSTGKNYFARTTVPVLGSCDDAAVLGQMHVIVFRPGDGTGLAGIFPQDCIIEERYQKFGEGLLPRKKDGVTAEVAIPLFSIMGDQVYIIHINKACLDLVVLDWTGKKIAKAGTIGLTPEEFAHHAAETRKCEPSMFLTTGYSKTGRRLFDPHSVVNNTGFVQAAGFLAIKDARNPLADFFDKYARLPRETLF